MKPHWSDVPEYAEADVVVVGAGSAGVAAAVSAARTGASTVLLERHGFLGGTSTAVLDTFYGFYLPGEDPRKVVGGVGDEVVERLEELGPVVRRPNSFGAGTGITYHPEHLKVVWEAMASEAGVRTLLYATLQDAWRADRTVREILVATKAGLRRIRGAVFVDASGDADLCHFAGLGYELAGEVEPAQTLTTTFRMCNVDLERRREISKADLVQLMREAAARGDYDLPRREGSDHITPIDGVTATIMTRLDSFSRVDGRVVNATDPDFLTAAETHGRRQALEYVRFLRGRVPGYENASLAGFSAQIGVRETRRVHGDYRLTREDVLTGRQFDDQIGLCGAPIEDHHAGTDTLWSYPPPGAAVGIPFRTIVARDADNVLVAGRCFSATHDAHAAVRSMAQCMAMGQAAGTAAGLARTAQTPPRELSSPVLQERLRTGGALLFLDDAEPGVERPVDDRRNQPTGR